MQERQPDSEREFRKGIWKGMKETRDAVTRIENIFMDGQVVLAKDCLKNATNGGQPVLQREFKRTNKLIYWVMGIVFGGGSATAGIVVIVRELIK